MTYIGVFREMVRLRLARCKYVLSSTMILRPFPLGPGAQAAGKCLLDWFERRLFTALDQNRIPPIDISVYTVVIFCKTPALQPSPSPKLLDFSLTFAVWRRQRTGCKFRGINAHIKDLDMKNDLPVPYLRDCGDGF